MVHAVGTTDKWLGPSIRDLRYPVGVTPDHEPRSLGIDVLVADGRTSTITQFTELARQAGLDIAAARTQASGRYVVECRPHEGGAP